MARSIRSASLENRTARLKLPVRKKPYTARVAQGVRLAYRRNQSGGVWSVLKSDGAGGSWLQKFALADDHEDANGSTILDYWAACDVARKLARGDDGGVEVDAGRPVTVSAAIDAYARALRARDGGGLNATILRYHLPPVLLSKPVAMLTAPEVRGWRDSLPEKGLKRATANRYMKALKACLTMAADDDDRITNRGAWKLKSLEDDTKARNVVITEAQVRDVLAASYKTGGKRFGPFGRGAGDDRHATLANAAVDRWRPGSRSQRRSACTNAVLAQREG